MLRSRFVFRRTGSVRVHTRKTVGDMLSVARVVSASESPLSMMTKSNIVWSRFKVFSTASGVNKPISSTASTEGKRYSPEACLDRILIKNVSSRRAMFLAISPIVWADSISRKRAASPNCGFRSNSTTERSGFACRRLAGQDGLDLCKRLAAVFIQFQDEEVSNAVMVRLRQVKSVLSANDLREFSPEPFILDI